jgi:hypothetical protein
LLSLWDGTAQGGLAAVLESLPGLLDRPDFWLWFYLTLAVSSTMLPSASDRRAWLPLSFTFVLLLGLSLLVGAGPWLLENLALPLNRVLQAVSVVFGISLLVHLFLFPPLWAIRRLMEWLMGVEVV